ncbi:MAG: penicillin-binding transpeptidase domain-containing protein [Candidatus Howiella sp.]
MATGPTKSMWTRMMAIMLVLVIGFMGVSIVRLTQLMVIDSAFYQEKASEQQLYDTELSPERGNIYDANRNILATSATVWTVYITPNDFDDDAQREKVASGLSQILGMEYETVLGYAKKTSSYVIVKKKVEKSLADQVRQFISDESLGSVIGLDEATKRYYPNDNLASVVLGFVGDDNQGLSGIESYYETELKGVPGRVVAAKNARGADMPFSYEKKVESTPGNSLVLTIDSYIQHVAEKYLEQAVADNSVTERGVCIVMDVNTGGVLAMAVKGDFNPNDPFTLTDPADQEELASLAGEERQTKLSELLNHQWRNKAVSDPYEPGSVFKIITGAAALEEHATDSTKSYSCPGYIVIAGQRYSCHKTTGHGTESLEQAFQNSCNPVFITLGQLLGVSTFSHYFDAFGLTQTTGIDLPGEAGSIYHAEANMGLVELASTSFGQTFKVTPIQLITAISAAVNGGYLVQPHVVSQILDADGNVVKNVDTVQKRQVISSETSEKLCALLEAVVDGGGGKNAYVAGYRIGGKTGTSEKVADELAGTGERLRISSFCGIAPTDDPQVAVLVLLDEPHAANVYGGTIAAPVGGQVLGDILPYLGYEPNYTEEDMIISVKVPGVTGKTLSEAKAALSGESLTTRVVGNGDTVLSQSPGEGQYVSENGVIVLYTDDSSEQKTATVPDFTGQTVSSVNTAAKNAGVNVVFSGSSLTASGVVAYKQSVEKGTEVAAGTSITVYFRSEDNSD